MTIHSSHDKLLINVITTLGYLNIINSIEKLINVIGVGVGVGVGVGASAHVKRRLPSVGSSLNE